MSNFGDPIDDGELLYRRVVGYPDYYNPSVDDKPSDQAFRPIQNDLTGLSLYRAKYRTPESIVGCKPGRCDYVAVLRVDDLTRAGITVVLDDPNVPDHVEIQSMRYDNRTDDEVIKNSLKLAKELSLYVLGPFDPLLPST